MEYITPLLTGAVVGIAFAALKLPIPAPPTITGILGIVGIWLGYIFISSIK